MENRYDQFEEFLQDQLKNHKLYPSDGVWREIHNKLHGDKKWPALTIAAFIVIAATIIVCAHFASKRNIFAIKPSLEPIAATAQQSTQKDDVLNSLTSSAPFAKHKVNADEPAVSTTDIAEASPAASSAPDVIETPEEVAVSHEVLQPGNTAQQVAVRQRLNPEEVTVYNLEGTTATELEHSLPLIKLQPSVTNISALPLLTTHFAKQKVASLKAGSTEASDKNIADAFLQEHGEDVALHTAEKPQTSKHKYSIQVYAAPSISYRKLNEDPSTTKEARTAGSLGSNSVPDVNNVVRHKPGRGIEAGVSLLYNLTSSLRLKSGLQFNLRQYSIEAYRSSAELARIALNDNDTLNTLAVYRTNNGYYSTELKNRFYQLSLPIGLEWEILGNDKFAWNVAGSIQPTYLLNRNVYLLSTNLKNYTEVPGIIRRWNLNSNIETFVSYKTRKLMWQLGPQLRYQPYSTFINEYSIHEHLMDYGFKLGVSTYLR